MEAGTGAGTAAGTGAGTAATRGWVRWGELRFTVDLDAARCLDAADYLARHARRYGIDAELELRRNPSGRSLDRHLVLGPRTGRRRWPCFAVQIWLDRDAAGRTRVALGVVLRRRRGGMWRLGPSPEQAAGRFLALLTETLQRTAAQRPTRRATRTSSDGEGAAGGGVVRVGAFNRGATVGGGQVVPLRPYAVSYAGAGPRSSRR